MLKDNKLESKEIFSVELRQGNQFSWYRLKTLLKIECLGIESAAEVAKMLDTLKDDDLEMVISTRTINVLEPNDSHNINYPARVICPNCGSRLKLAPRCPECGQLFATIL